MRPSPSRSASSIISCSSSSVRLSPNSCAMRFKFRKEIFPVSSSSNNANTLSISALEFLSGILPRIMSQKSLKSMGWLGSLLTSANMRLTSSFLTSKPRALSAAFSSRASMVPECSVSKRLKASLSSSICSSSRPCLWRCCCLPPRPGAAPPARASTPLRPPPPPPPTVRLLLSPAALPRPRLSPKGLFVVRAMQSAALLLPRTAL
mmetsp:Transcript_34672/g.80483  ORF Transcript_34672/g.80483 Transcript_34672/m.80483 type:complete len:206 (+) Transcript_34672:166-783(+)